MANFFAVQGHQIRYLAIVRKSDGTVSVARTTISTGTPDSGWLERKNVIFDPGTGTVTVQYKWPLTTAVLMGVTIPFILWLAITAMVGMACRARWSKPIFTSKRAAA